jgi:ribosome-binding protein aMBF1 (putative translation factor)
LYTVDKENRETEVFNVTIRIAKSHWDNDRNTDIRERLQLIVKHSTVYVCGTCKQFFSESDGPTCPRTRHKGKQVELSPAVMEEMAEDEEEEGQFYTMVKYSVVESWRRRIRAA